MHQQLFSRLGLASGEQFSQPVAMGDNNTMQCDCVTFGGVFNVTYEESNDLENWGGVATEFSSIAVPYALLDSKTVTAAYVRVKVKYVSGSVVASVGVNISQQ